MSDILQPKKLFNPDASQSFSDRKLIGAETTNMMILSKNKYSWSMKIYRHMMGNFWIPETIKLGQDKLQYTTELTNDERETFDKIISFLVFLDSLQTANLPNINDFVTLPEINLLLSIQQYQEALHSQSYGYILESIAPDDDKLRIYNIATTDPYLVSRNKIIADYYEEFIQNQSKHGFAKVCMANYILEGLYFYAGFSFFYNLARNKKLTGVAQEIRYINRDELSHLALFEGIFRELRREEPEIFTAEFENELREMMRGAVEAEIEWSEYAIGNKIQGLNTTILSSYIKYISNLRLDRLGLEPLYPEVIENPCKFVDEYTRFNEMKTDFFEDHETNYTRGNLKIDEVGEINIDNIDI
jgi:ribonucleoside-diphosphate reductase beta chain